MDLQTVEIFLDTATYDEIERDVKVTTEAVFCAPALLRRGGELIVPNVIFETHFFATSMMSSYLGDNGSSSGPHWWNHGPPHWLLHPQWGRDSLLSDQALHLIEDYPLLSVLILNQRTDLMIKHL